MKSSTQDKVEGTAKDIAGRVKEAAGKVIGKPRLEANSLRAMNVPGVRCYQRQLAGRPVA